MLPTTLLYNELKAFLLLLLVSLSVPITKTIFLFCLTGNIGSGLLNTGAKGNVKFGVWGYCVSTIDVSVAGIDRSIAAQCSKAHLGYTFDSVVANALHVNRIQNLISRVTTAALVLHPIAAGLTFLTLLISLFMLKRGWNGTAKMPSLITLGAGLLATFLTTIVFLIDVILVPVVRHRISDASEGDLSLHWGNAVWVTLGATIALWLAMIGACACGRNRTRKSGRY